MHLRRPLRLSLLLLTAALTAVFFGMLTPPPATADNGATANPATDPAAARAWQWIRQQHGPATPPTSASVIRADRSYPADWTGAVSGTFTPVGVSSPIDDTAVLAVDSPASVPDTWAGVVTGHVTGVAPEAGRWIVQAYRRTASGTVQAPVQALVAPDGTFSIDLTAAGPVPDGSWSLGLLDATASYAPTGTPWPAAVYRDWQVRAYVVTDTAYLVGEQPAAANGTFRFADSRPGSKVFQLVDTATGAVLAEQEPEFGLVRSYAGSDRTYTYDQALALLTAVSLGDGDAARWLTDGLLTLRTADGGFVTDADARNPAAALPLERTGVVAVATYALLRRLATLDPADPQHAVVSDAARAGVQWLLARQRSDGLLGAGTGNYDSSGAFVARDDPGWVSTEHNLDAWQTLRLAATVLADPGLATDADRLAGSIVTTLWDTADGRFRQGLDAAGAPDDTDPLDVSSWGALFLSASGHPDLAAQALAHTAAFTSAVDGNAGYRAYHPQAAFPSAPANVWAEGTAGVALARTRLADQAAAGDLADLAALQRADGSLPYALTADTATSMTTSSSVAATSWFVLTRLPADQDLLW